MFKQYKFTDYLLLYIMVFLPVTNWTPIRRELYYFSFILAFFYFIKFKRKFTYNYIKVFLLFTFVLISQTLIFAKINFISVFGLYIALTLPYFVIKIFGRHYIKMFIDIVVTITIVSFIFYFPSLISPSFHTLIGSIAPKLGTDIGLLDQNFLIYTWEDYSSNGLIRNSGNFTEAGAFGCYLSLALALNTLRENKIWSKKNAILIIGIITTFSTASYFALYLIIIFFFLIVEKKPIKYLLIPVALFVALFTYKSLDFMQEKVNQQYTTQVEGELSKGRFGSTIADFEDFYKYPFFGRGVIKTTRFDGIETWEGDNAPRPLLNSFSDLLVRLGLLGFLLFCVWLFSSIKHFSDDMNFRKNSVYIIVGTLIIVLSAQNGITNVAFLVLLYLNDISFKNNLA